MLVFWCPRRWDTELEILVVYDSHLSFIIGSSRFFFWFLSFSLLSIPPFFSISFEIGSTPGRFSLCPVILSFGFNIHPVLILLILPFHIGYNCVVSPFVYYFFPPNYLSVCSNMFPVLILIVDLFNCFILFAIFLLLRFVQSCFRLFSAVNQSLSFTSSRRWKRFPIMTSSWSAINSTS